MLIWFGATHDVGGIDLATDIRVTTAGTGAFDLGVEVPIGNSLLVPMIGVNFNFAPNEMRVDTLMAPQLFAYVDAGPMYIEYWGQCFIESLLASDELVDDDGVSERDLARDTFYNRLQLFFYLSDVVQLGPQVELTLALNDGARGPDDDVVVSLPVGIGTNVAYGEHNMLGLWLAYETDGDARNTLIDINGDEVTRGITGRFTFVRVW